MKIIFFRTNIRSVIKDQLDEIINNNFALSSSYKVQAQYSETIKLENKTTENLINQTYQELLIKLTENILSK